MYDKEKIIDEATKGQIDSRFEELRDRSMIQAVDLTKRYEDGLLALDHLNIDIKPGQIYCLLGANGAGKTTVINLFFNFIEPTSGSARINGYDCAREPLKTKKYAAYIPENVMLYGNFSARQNLDFFARLTGRDELKKEDYHMVMRQVGLPESSFEKRVKTFSKGMRQKLGIAIAILKQAAALILDEPTSGLDPKAAADFVEQLFKLRNEGRAILMSTHDIFRAKEIADVVGIMKEGVLITEKTKEDIDREDLEKSYLRYMGVD
ncbi:MAG TPA: ABC transporter ATP-binding protein [Candidatus Acidoferrales bacterium]|nr:ABC transporter ATP-binding protein [Candidatus Acidoferrales bacterium]